MASQSPSVGGVLTEADRLSPFFLGEVDRLIVDRARHVAFGEVLRPADVNHFDGPCLAEPAAQFDKSNGDDILS